MNEITDNLYRFYEEAGTLPAVSLVKSPAYSMVSGYDNTWPQMVYNTDLSENPGEKLAHALRQTMTQKLPGFAVCDARMFKTEDLEFLRDHGIYPVKSWTLMDAVPDVKCHLHQPHDVEILKLTTTDQLFSFSALVNSELMQTVKIDPDLMIQLHKKQTIHSYGLFAAGELISGLLTYSDAQSTGLYFIVTKTGYRGQGLAERLIGHVMHLLFPKKTKKVVLQAVQKAVPLYKRLGFKSQGKLIIFWKR